jgi:hypothetical protein
VAVTFYPSNKLVMKMGVPANATVRIDESGSGVIVTPPDAGGGGPPDSGGAGGAPGTGGAAPAGGSGGSATGGIGDSGATTTAGCACGVAADSGAGISVWLAALLLGVYRRPARRKPPARR